MVTQVYPVSYHPEHHKAFIFQFFDAHLNSKILLALLHGMYTGILAVTLWNIFINKCWRIRRALVVVIILLHALITIDFATAWSLIHSVFIENGQNFQTVYLKLNNEASTTFLVGGITSSMSTILADLYIIWCCWMVWGRHWPVVLLPILSLIAATDTGALYSVVIVGIAKGIAPTLLIGRAAVGHTRPNDECDGSTVSSLQFQAPSEAGTASFQESSIESAVEADTEAQQEQPDELVVVVERHNSVQDESLN
ncbi:hypothetical protein ARMGADRAFT_1029294 [Armillaria gallica]|uniref:Uncharacterized protein n=1 Tax=Armillaria gallica TaxID=47427 RepID=A0A2H3DM67_ARMGA|nr:hypothetical protein ARMGADRAFT_1029294 [Armillaria gallica]